MSQSDVPRLVFGIPGLDEQHDQLLQLAGQMRAAFEECRPVDELRRLAALFTLRTRLHFMDEETFMEGAGYPGLASHRRRHAEFTEGLLRLQARLRPNHLQNLAEILDYELRWIREHLEEEDDELGRWLQQSKLFSEPPQWEPAPHASSIPTSPP